MNSDCEDEDFSRGEVLMLSNRESLCGLQGCAGVLSNLTLPPSRPLPGTVRTLRQLSLERIVRQLLGFLKESRRDQDYTAVSSWLSRLDGLVSEVIWRVQEWRSPWIPLDLHWVEVEVDPLLRLVALLPKLHSLNYNPLSLTVTSFCAALVGLPLLTCLQLSHTASDALLRLLPRDCPSLQILNLQGSRGVTDNGLRRLLLLPSASSRCAWRFLYRRWREMRPLRSRTAGGGRGGDDTRGLVEYQVLLPPLPPARLRTPLSFSLKHLDLRATRVSKSGAAWAARCVPSGHLLILECNNHPPFNYHSRAGGGGGTKRYHSLEESSPPGGRRLPPSP